MTSAIEHYKNSICACSRRRRSHGWAWTLDMRKNYGSSLVKGTWIQEPKESLSLILQQCVLPIGRRLPMRRVGKLSLRKARGGGVYVIREVPAKARWPRCAISAHARDVGTRHLGWRQKPGGVPENEVEEQQKGAKDIHERGQTTKILAVRYQYYVGIWYTIHYIKNCAR